MAIHVVTIDNQHAYAEALHRMFSARRLLYREGVGWDGVAGDDGRDADSFDNENATYLINLNANSDIVAACRLIPSTMRNLCTERFGHLVEGLLPVGPDIWELGRWMLIPDPAGDGSIDEGEHLSALACGAMEFALERNIAAFIAVGSENLACQLDANGWAYQKLCDEYGGGPNIFHIEAGTVSLAATRAATGISAPTLYHQPAPEDTAITPDVRQKAQSLINNITDFIEHNPQQAEQILTTLNNSLKMRPY